MSEVDAPLFILMLSEIVFGICCIIQCTVNWSAHSYVGGASACALQGLYAAYYTFASPGLCAVTALIGARALAPSASHAAWPPCVGLTAGVLVHVDAELRSPASAPLPDEVGIPSSDHDLALAVN